jgi:hypothetical protein
MPLAATLQEVFFMPFFSQAKNQKRHRVAFETLKK